MAEKTQEVDVSPLQELREHLGLTRAEMAALAGLAYSTIYNAEVGLDTCLPRRLRDALANLGVDVTTLERSQRVWLDKRALALQERFRQSMTTRRMATGGHSEASGAEYACPRRPWASAPSPEPQDTRGEVNAPRTQA